MPKDLPMNGMRRNDDAMKSNSPVPKNLLLQKRNATITRQNTLELVKKALLKCINTSANKSMEKQLPFPN